VQRVGCERIAVVPLGHRVKAAGAREVDRDGEQKNQKRPDTVTHRNRVDKNPNDRFGGNPYAGGEHQEGFNETRKIFDLGVAVRVIVVGGFVGDAHAEQREAGSDEIDSRVSRIGQHAQRAGHESDHQLERGNNQSRAERQEGRAALFRTGAGA
jgi:hypothetical protein